MQAELRSAKSELVTATKEIRAATKELQRAAEDVGKPKVPKPPAPATVGTTSATLDGAEAAVTCTGWPKCEIKRPFLDQLLADINVVKSQFPSRPIRTEGKLSGYRLHGVKAGSVANLLGLKNGDRVEAINGVKLLGPGALKRLRGALRKASRISARIGRGDGVVHLVIAVKEA